MSNNDGGGGLQNIDSLVGLTQVSEIKLDGNLLISCDELNMLISGLCSPPVDTDTDINTADIPTDGVNCTAP